MIQTGITLDGVVKFIQKYIGIIVIVPAFIGGLWQLVELASISFPFIRFFSLSQIVPDGLLILLILLMGLANFMLGWLGDVLFFNKGERKVPEKLNDGDYENFRKKQVIIWILLFLFFYITSIFYYLKIVNNSSELIDIKFSIGLALIFIFTLNGSLNKCYYYANDKFKGWFKSCNVLLLILYVIISTYFCKKIHNDLLTTNNIENIKSVKTKVALKFPNTKQELLYFNDKYIFIKISNIPKKDKKGKTIKQKGAMIYITELNKLFED